MAKQNYTPPATTAKTATKEVESGKPTGLLGGELDFFFLIGLGFGASERAKKLVLLGLQSECRSELEEVRRKLKKPRGRPPKDFPEIDVQRATAVLGAVGLWRDRLGEEPPTQKAAIEMAIQIDEILFKTKARDERLFGVSLERLQTSVSNGLKVLGKEGRFSK
jgi:hypothetical protein